MQNMPRAYINRDRQKQVLITSHMNLHAFLFQPYDLQRQWSGYKQASGDSTRWDTGVHLDTLKFVGAKSVALPDDFVSIVIYILSM